MSVGSGSVQAPTLNVENVLIMKPVEGAQPLELIVNLQALLRPDEGQRYQTVRLSVKALRMN